MSLIIKSSVTEGDKAGMCIDLVSNEGEGKGSINQGERTEVLKEEEE